MAAVATLLSRKTALRAELIARRAAQAPRLGPAAAAAIGDRLVSAFRLPKGAIVSAYWPLPGELDPRPCALRLAAAGHKLALPRMHGPDRPLTFHLW
ncbi:MAG: 5-formyltetrahydrofolate cyclo-ligase, partial [Geminicoccales bacterium]